MGSPEEDRECANGNVSSEKTARGTEYGTCMAHGPVTLPRLQMRSPLPG